jgi:hypothetical protein
MIHSINGGSRFKFIICLLNIVGSDLNLGIACFGDGNFGTDLLCIGILDFLGTLNSLELGSFLGDGNTLSADSLYF